MGDWFPVFLFRTFWIAGSVSKIIGSFDEMFRNNPYAEQFAENNFAPGFLGDVDGSDVIVRTNYGFVRGRRRHGLPEAGGTVFTVDWFLGVPYARPPVGNLRFKAPRPIYPWQGVLNATKFPKACPQNADLVYVDKEMQDESCLFLNIYTPHDAANPNKTFPVMVYIHGGSYMGGSGSMYFGHLLAQYEVVLVTINYRLGILGFACTSYPELSGNYGLLDQIEALRWIQANIGAFRGDPQKVTLFGNSAGGSSVSLLGMSPKANGLFTNAIGQSGSPLSFWATHNRSVDLDSHVLQVARMLGCRRNTLPEAHACMMRTPWEAYANVLRHELPRISPSATDFKPCIDGDVIPDMPYDYLINGNINIRSLMTGVVKNEWSRHLGYLIHELYDVSSQFDEILRNGFRRKEFTSAVDHVITNRFGWDRSVADMVKHEYTNWSAMYDPLENRRLYCQMVSDLAMVAPTVELSRLVHNRGVPVYVYHFAHHAAERDWRSSYHQIELQYVFGAPFLGLDVYLGSPYAFTDNDRTVSRTMMEMWTSFALHGRPITPESLNVEWQQFTPMTTDYLSIHADHRPELEMKQHLRSRRVHFWNYLVPNMLADIEMRANTSEDQCPGEQTKVWLLAVFCVVLSITSVVTLVFVTCLHTRYRRLSTDVRSNSVPT